MERFPCFYVIFVKKAFSGTPAHNPQPYPPETLKVDPYFRSSARTDTPAIFLPLSPQMV